VRLWPRSLVGRVVLVLLATVTLQFLVSALVYEGSDFYLPDAHRAKQVAERLALTRLALAAVPPARRNAIAEALSDDELQLAWSGEPAASEEASADSFLLELHDRLLRARPDLVGSQLRLFDGTESLSGRISELSGELSLPDRTRLRFSVNRISADPSGSTQTILFLALVTGCVVGASIMLVHTLAEPLRSLARAADAIGHGTPVVVGAGGPREVRKLAGAFNAMQDRIVTLVAARTLALAAVSHDLRTPIGRLRLRAGFVRPLRLQEEIEQDLHDMETMVSSVLSYMAGEADPEMPRFVDVAVMLMTMVDAAADEGRDISYHGPSHAVATVRPSGIKRGLDNLIKNALKYGGNARVSLERLERRLRIRVDDDGPGIPSAELKLVLEPFYRVEASRNAATGGVGLGLTIAHRAVLRESGEFVLTNRPEGGLRIEITLAAQPG